MPKNASYATRRVFLIIGSIIAGGAFAFLLIPTLFSVLPNELVRSNYLLKALRSDASPNLEMVVLGNSIAMNGVDAKRLSRELADHPVTWNLSSPGQQLFETMLLADELPNTTKTVLLTLFTRDLDRDFSNVPIRKLIAYLQYGYHPSAATLSTLRQAGSPEVVRLLNKHKWQVALNSRWTLRSAMDISCRSLLRKDLNLANAATNLFYPTPYTRQLSKQAIKVVIARMYHRRDTRQGHLSNSTAELLKALLEHLSKRRIAVAIAMLPEHPELRQRTENGFYYQLLTELRQLGNGLDVPVFSFISLLDDTQFIDHIHPNAKGAKILTDALAHEVAMWHTRRGD